MSLIADSDLTVTPSPVSLSATITFAALIQDPDVDKPTSATVGLHLADSNEITFADGTKSVSQNIAIGPKSVKVTFARKLKGGDGLKAFKVTMKDAAGNVLVTAFPRIK